MGASFTISFSLANANLSLMVTGAGIMIFLKTMTRKVTYDEDPDRSGQC